jgi:hypothetical protein
VSNHMVGEVPREFAAIDGKGYCPEW